MPVCKQNIAMAKKEMTVSELAKLGGLGRRKALSKKRRQEIASNASKERWAKMTPKQRSAFGRAIRRKGIANAREQ